MAMYATGYNMNHSVSNSLCVANGLNNTMRTNKLEIDYGIKTGDIVENINPNSKRFGKRARVTSVCFDQWVHVAYDKSDLGSYVENIQQGGWEGKEYINKWRNTYKIINTSMIKTLSNMMKKLLDSDTQTLVKADYINGDLELTSEGSNALLTVLFVANKAALLTMAQTAIDEAEKNKE